jgi:DNA polymerase-1
MPIQLSPFYRYETGQTNKTLVMDGESFQAMHAFLMAGKSLVFDFETSGLEYFKHAESCGIALGSWDIQGVFHSYYVPYRHHTGEQQLDLGLIAPAIQGLLADQRTLKIAHHIKFDEHMAQKEGWQVRGPRYDTMIGAYFYDENTPKALKTRAQTDLGIVDASAWESRLDAEVHRLAKLSGKNIGEYKNQYGYSQVNIPLAGVYACYDVDFAGQLFSFYEKKGLSHRYPRVWATEMELTGVLCKMEAEGMLVDVPYLTQLREQLGRRKEEVEREFSHVTGGAKFNLASDDALREFLQKDLGLRLTKLTKKKQLSVDKEVLEYFAETHRSIPLIMDWREAEKLYNTYTKSILDRLDDRGYVHPDYQQVGTDTGRTSCKTPNFQNISSDSDARAVKHTGKKLEDGGADPWSVRRAFLNRGPGWVRLLFDYSQIELRVLAHYSQDPVMVGAYLAGEDIHSRTSMEVFGTAEKSKRRMAKVINFGLSYCMTPVGFARQAKVSEEEAEGYFKKFFERYSGVTTFRQKFWGQVRRNNGGFCNLFGRPRRIFGMNAKSDYERGKAERQAIASIIQGTAAELTKESLVRIAREFSARQLDAHPVATIHDEIQIDCRVDDMPQVARLVKGCMENYPEFAPIPILVDASWTTTNWSEKKGIK